MRIKRRDRKSITQNLACWGGIFLAILFVPIAKVLPRWSTWWRGGNAEEVFHRSRIRERATAPLPLCPDGQRGPSPATIESLWSQRQTDGAAAYVHRRVLVYRESAGSTAGWGNRLLGIASAFVVAAVSQRTLFIDVPGFGQVLNYTNDLRRWDAVVTPKPLTLRWRLVEDDHIITRLSGRMRRQYERLASAAPETWFRRTDGSDAAIAVWESNQWLVPLLYLNPHLRETLCARLGSRPFHVVANRLFQPAPAVQQVMARFCHRTGLLCQADDPSNTSKSVIGVHVRAHASAPRWRPHRVRGRRLDALWKCARLAQAHRSKSCAFFVSSDSPSVLRAAGAILSDSHVARVVPALDANASAVAPEHLNDILAVADMMLLARCEPLVLSAGSTFGMCAAGLSRSSSWPFTITRMDGCVRVPQREPCQHHFYRMWSHAHASRIAEMVNHAHFGCLV
ncbi:hypothetical protein CDCA_CDCA17G4338 [Cyanidium caldarium]|uniref:Fucosyltransferase n=1 Tax=Cyanidium caldarium TaxID=2771 RepID=A0AAV9J1U0_CYACA|nr:hypothetical protein CDCA_CDCA17G4338 [Cyanidium caldarium]